MQQPISVQLERLQSIADYDRMAVLEEKVKHAITCSKHNTHQLELENKVLKSQSDTAIRVLQQQNDLLNGDVKKLQQQNKQLLDNASDSTLMQSSSMKNQIILDL